MVNKTKILVSLLTGVALLASALPSGVAAKGPANVAATVHNFSSTARDSTGGPSQFRSNQTEICVFCHTPHGGSLTGPLWNRTNPTSPWQHYDSQTLGSYLGNLANNRPVSDESLLCMSCHDGSIAVNHLINAPNAGPSPVKSLGGDDMEIGLGFVVGSRIGGSPGNEMGVGDLRDDHPISFSYDDVWNSADYQGTGAKVGKLHPVAFAESPPFSPGEGVRFFNRPMNGLGGNRVECSTCHDPHVEYGSYAGVNMDYAPFLIMKNAGSNLCLACHNK